MRYLGIVSFFLLGMTMQSYAQILTDKVFTENIRTIQFFQNNLDVTQPIVFLNRTQLMFQFDELNDESKNYEFTILHCNADWTPSVLRKIDYIDGFESDEIREFSYSFNTYRKYVHYKFTIPNNSFKITKSGNYILQVYESGDTSKTIIQKRFMVVNEKTSISPTAFRSSIVALNRTHQQVDFTVKSDGLNLENPACEVRVNVMQNYDWNLLKTGIKSRYMMNNTIYYDMLDETQFSAGREWRILDMRSFRYTTDKVQNIGKVSNNFVLQLSIDEPRAFEKYYFNKDFNGRFISQNVDRLNPENESDYADVLFTLKMPYALQNMKVYVYGELTNYELKPEYEMEYFDRAGQYELQIPLKQGYYNYRYVLVDDKGNIDYETLEGNNFETENDYQIMVYYRAPGEFYDQLIGFTNVNTLRK